MSNIVDAFTHSPVYTNIMEDCKESLAGAIPWGFFHAKNNDHPFGWPGRTQGFAFSVSIRIISVLPNVAT